jgi:hypothetical protein
MQRCSKNELAEISSIRYKYKTECKKVAGSR